MQLQLLISTFGDRIRNIENLILDKRENISYLISCQVENTAIDLPESLDRDDITIISSYTKGLSKNRNNCLRHATGDIVMILDDDVKLKHEYLDRVLSFFNDSEVDLAVSKIETPEGQPEYKHYSDQSYFLNNIKQLKNVSSVEISFRLKPLIEKSIFFNEAFGLGMQANSGEELIFLNECMRKGLKIKYFPEYTVCHDFESSTKVFSPYSEKRLFVAGAQAAALFGKAAYFRNFISVLFRLKDLIKLKISVLKFLKYKNDGVAYFFSFDSRKSSKQR